MYLPKIILHLIFSFSLHASVESKRERETETQRERSTAAEIICVSKGELHLLLKLQEILTASCPTQCRGVRSAKQSRIHHHSFSEESELRNQTLYIKQKTLFGIQCLLSMNFRMLLGYELLEII